MLSPEVSAPVGMIPEPVSGVAGTLGEEGLSEAAVGSRLPAGEWGKYGIANRSF